jgi:hypothetical protein
MRKIYDDEELSDSYTDNLRSISKLSSTLKKCQSLISKNKMLFQINNSQSGKDDSDELYQKYNLDVDITKKENADFINKRMKQFFNIENYEQNIKKEAWKKDITKMFLGLNNNVNNIEGNDNSENELAEYNFEKREKKKEGLMFLKNFFKQMKSIKRNKLRKDLKKERAIKLNKYDNYNYNDNHFFEKKINDEEINFLINKLRNRYSPKKVKEENKNEKKNEIINSLTETNVNKNSITISDKIKDNLGRKSLFHPQKSINQTSQRFNTENNYNENNNSLNDKFSFPQIKNSFSANRYNTINNEKIKNVKKSNENSGNRYNTISNDYQIRKRPYKIMKKGEAKNIKANISDKNIFNKNKGINRNKIYLEQLKQIYKSKSNNKYKTLNKNNGKLEIPELLHFRDLPLIKKNNQYFFSPLHYSKFAQMKGIRDKLIGIFDNEVFTIYNKNI